jgi:hypothetical protein
MPTSLAVSPLAERQRAFSAALLDSYAAVPPGLSGPDGVPSARRFSVYRNNVVAGLSEALKASYPAVCRIVGEDFFRAMAREFVRAEPPRSPLLFEYGAGFAGFIERFEPSRSLPYLPDVARIERAWSEAYYAADADPLQPAELAAIPEEELAGIRFRPHPSLRVARSRYPALTIWRMNVADGVPAPVDLSAGGEDCLIVRPAAEVVARSVPPGGAVFLMRLIDGGTLYAAADAALAEDGRFDLAANLAGLLAAGAFTAIERGSST